MIFSPSEVLPIAESTGFRAEMIEKVLHLLNLLDKLNRHPMLKGKWVLKGGTALNLFVFDLPRLSVDIDLNYVGVLEREALPARGQARDLFDSHQIFTMKGLDRERLRLAFVVYGGMNRKDWRTVSIADVNFDAAELARLLIPTLHVRETDAQVTPAEYGASLVRECREGLSAVLPFTDSERTFLDLLLDRGEIDPTLLTADTSLQRHIRSQPLLEWKALNVKRHKGLA